MPCEEISTSEVKRTFLGIGQSGFPRRLNVTHVTFVRSTVVVLYHTSGLASYEVQVAELTSELVPLQVRLPRELCSAHAAFLRLRDGGNVPWMRLSSAVGFLGLQGAADSVFLQRHEERGRREKVGSAIGQAWGGRLLITL